MWASVSANWVGLNQPLEGVLPFMYLDQRGLVTTGMGNLIDTSRPLPAEPTDAQREASHRLAAQIAWLNQDNTPAPADAIAAEWDNVKGRTDLAQQGGGAFAAPVTSLHIDDGEITRIVTDRLTQNEATLTGRPEFSEFANWPADAQFGLLSMSWALGAGFRFPNFQAAAAIGDWETAADQCVFGPHVGTIEKRNAMDQQCFHNATQVVKQGLDPSVLLIAG
jgi:GH24 family phage-related lysozyme (muramidase)